eukprot:c5749_g1_i2.p1 GENE.c5749_g1_i2~~c5749_g1_i2.p1  ORF type:complete len:342 (-),score=80.51 c5749_g1_i2:36-1061(-)
MGRLIDCSRTVMKEVYGIHPLQKNTDPTSPEITEVCRILRDSEIPPIHSGFRVTAAIVFERSESGERFYATGSNIEAANIAVSICGERSALLKLREVPGPWKILAIHIASDSASFITPGTLCRELLSEFATPDTPIVMGCARNTHPSEIISLGELYPHNHLFSKVPKDVVEATAVAFSKSAQFPNSEPEKQLVAAAMECLQQPPHNTFHPMRYACAVLFENNQVIVEEQSVALEYGASIDAVCMVAAQLRRKATESKPILLVQSDQFGVLHAPFAAGRVWLFENGFHNVPILVHRPDGLLATTTAEELVPKFHRTTFCSAPSVKLGGLWVEEEECAECSHN